MVTFTLRPLYPPGKQPRYPLDRRLGGSENRSGRGGEDEKILPCRESNRGRSARSLVTTLTELFQLQQHQLTHSSSDFS